MVSYRNMGYNMRNDNTFMLLYVAHSQQGIYPQSYIDARNLLYKHRGAYAADSTF